MAEGAQGGSACSAVGTFHDLIKIVALASYIRNERETVHRDGHVLYRRETLKKRTCATIFYAPRACDGGFCPFTLALHLWNGCVFDQKSPVEIVERSYGQEKYGHLKILVFSSLSFASRQPLDLCCLPSLPLTRTGM